MGLDLTKMTISSLACKTIISPNHSYGRTMIIDRITPHFMGGDCTIEQCGEIFKPIARQASSNYGIGSDGRIACYVLEENRPWTSGNSSNDNRAITIECANLQDDSLTEKCWNSLIALCADICKRYGFKGIQYTGSIAGRKESYMLLTMHKWFQETDCPGSWLSNNFALLAQKVNELLDTGKIIPIPQPTPTAFGGMYVCKVRTLNVRDNPSVNSNIITCYNAGEIVELDNWYESHDGYIWGRYTGLSSGKLRYVAVGRDTGKVEVDDYLVKVN